MSEFVAVEQDGFVLRLKFNRPDRKNAITADMYAAFAGAMTAAETDDAIRVLMFESEGDVFTAGNDINDFMAGGADNSDAPVVRFLQALAKADKPLVAAVQGPAVGVGVTMLLHCDLVYAASRATFKTPFVDLGLVPEAASSLLLPAIAGHQRAAAMLLAGETIDAETAVQYGFVNRIADDVVETALSAAKSLAEKAPTAVRLSKRLMKSGRDQVLAHMAEEGTYFNKQLKSAEFREAGLAFLQKRKPDFSKAS